jgi:hypothetical protein
MRYWCRRIAIVCFVAAWTSTVAATSEGSQPVSGVAYGSTDSTTTGQTAERGAEATRAHAVESLGLVPLSTLGKQTYQGSMGGLYAEGRNEPWGAHAAALRRVHATIGPLDANGKPDPNGKIVVIGIGASVCVQIFGELEELGPKTPGISPAVVFVNCAKGGHDVTKISDPERHYWESARATVERTGFSPAQVQVAWYQSDDLQDQRDDFPGRPQRLAERIANNMRELKQHFSNTRICYHSARHTTAFMPHDEGKAKRAEPRPYYVGWAVKWLIEEQTAGKTGLKFEAPDAQAPLLAWATYFWTDADQPRHDGYRWTPSDVVQDGVHLSATGKPRVAKELLDFWQTDPFAKDWFNTKTARPSKLTANQSVPAVGKELKPAQIAAQNTKPDEPALIINGKSKFAKLERLLATTEPVRLVVFDMAGKQLLTIDDVFHKHTELNTLLEPGEYRLHFLGRDGQRLKMTMDVPDVVTLK